ncbi:MAG: hypothetical protein LBE32_05750 [Burkholderiales bacterium]|jgi:hypothetical protein|nr:hypothetical protein [Burkholderiales bacterium]
MSRRINGAFNSYLCTNTSPVSRRTNGFAFLEVLISIILLALPIVALMATQAHAVTIINEMQYRIEAMHLANSYAAKIWGANKKELHLYKEGGEEYEKFAARIMGNGFPKDLSIPGATLPSVTIDAMAGGGNHVLITISWRSPKEKALRNYTQESFISH